MSYYAGSGSDMLYKYWTSFSKSFIWLTPFCSSRLILLTPILMLVDLTDPFVIACWSHQPPFQSMLISLAPFFIACWSHLPLFIACWSHCSFSFFVDLIAYWYHSPLFDCLLIKLTPLLLLVDLIGLFIIALLISLNPFFIACWPHVSLFHCLLISLTPFFIA